MSIEANITLIVKRLGELREELKRGNLTDEQRAAIVQQMAAYEKNLAQIAEALGKGSQSEADFEEWRQADIKRPDKKKTKELFWKERWR